MIPISERAFLVNLKSSVELNWWLTELNFVRVFFDVWGLLTLESTEFFLENNFYMLVKLSVDLFVLNKFLLLGLFTSSINSNSLSTYFDVIYFIIY